MDDLSADIQLELKSFIEDCFLTDQIDQLAKLNEEYHPADIAEVLDELSPRRAVLVFGMLSDEVASEVLDETGSLVRQEIVEQVDDERLADLLDELNAQLDRVVCRLFEQDREQLQCARISCATCWLTRCAMNVTIALQTGLSFRRYARRNCRTTRVSSSSPSSGILVLMMLTSAA